MDVQQLPSIESEFASTEEADAYGVWLRAKVAESLADSRPTAPHDQVMADVQAIIDGKRPVDAAR